MYLAIEGVIGVGKTSLARLLQRALGTHLLLEEFEDNPFLSSFYADRDRYALQTELFFLMSRYQQQRVVPDWLATAPVVADFTFAKSGLFAGLTLHGDELRLYQHLHGALMEKTLAPDLLVYLRAPTSLLLERIARRGRAYEKAMDPAYLAALTQAYDTFCAHTTIPTLVVDAAPLDFVNNPDDLRHLAERIRVALGVPYQLPLEAPPG